MPNAEKTSSITVPNIITIGRIAAVPVVAWLMLSEAWKPAFWLFTIAALSDGVDGAIARWFNQVSPLGARLDPVADKALLATTFILLAVSGLLPVWLVALAVLRDILIIAGVALAQAQGQPFAVRPLFVSKATTFAQLVLVATAMAAQAYGLDWAGLMGALIWITAALTLASFATYGVVWMRHKGAQSGGR